MVISSKRCAVTFRYVQFAFLFHLLFIVNKSSSTELPEHKILAENGKERKLLSSDVRDNSGSVTIQPIEYSNHKTASEDEKMELSNLEIVENNSKSTINHNLSITDEKLKVSRNDDDNDDSTRIIHHTSNHNSLDESGKETKSLSNVTANSRVLEPFELARGNIFNVNRIGRKLSLDIEDYENDSNATELFELSKQKHFNETDDGIKLSIDAENIDDKPKINQQSDISGQIHTEGNEEENESSVVEDSIGKESGIIGLYEFEKDKAANENREGRTFSISHSEITGDDLTTDHPFQTPEQENKNGEGRKLTLDDEGKVNGSRFIPNSDVAYTASENFLEKIREHCRSQQALSIICNNLKLVIPISSEKPSDVSTIPVDSVTETTISNEKTGMQNSKTDRIYTIHKNPFTSGSLKYIRDHTENNHNPKNIQFKELSMNSNERMPTAYRQRLQEIYGYIDPSQSQISGDSYTNAHSQTESDKSNLNYNPISSNDNIPNHSNHQNHHDTWKQSNTNNFENLESTTEELYERQKMAEQEVNKSQENIMITRESPENRFTPEGGIYTENTENLSEKNEFTTPYSDDFVDFDDEEDGSADGEFTSEQSLSYTREGAETPQYLAEKRQEPYMESRTQWQTNITGGNNTEVVSKQPIRTMMERLVDTSLKRIFKNSLTIKFPTFETVTNKVKYWFEAMFGTKSRDEARGKLKKIYNPFLIGLFIKGIIIVTTGVGFFLKIFLAKAVFFSFATFLLGALFIFKKFSSPQGGTIYLNTGGGSSGYKSTATWDKDGFIGSSNPQRALKNVGSFTLVEGKRRKADYSTPYVNGDRYHQYYNAYYKPSNEFYTTTVNPFGT